MEPSFTRALPPYLGGKRRLAPLIFAELSRHVPRPSWRHLQLLDPMCGAGAVALHAKAFGFHTIASDLAERAALVAQALIANNDARLTKRDIASLFSDEHQISLPPDVSRILTQSERQWFAGALGAANRQPRPTGTLLRLLCTSIFLRLFPMSLPSATDAPAAAVDDFDRLSPARLGHYLKRREQLTPQRVWRAAERLNGGVFAGRGAALKGDARSVMALFDADVVYLDPPYAGTARYEHAYRAVDALLGDDRASGTPPTLDELLDAARQSPWLVLSYGGPSHDLQSLSELVGKHRRVMSALAVPYRHLGALATEEKNVRNREYLIIARR